MLIAFVEIEPVPSVGIAVAELLCRSGLCSSLSEGRRKIVEGGIKLADVRVGDPFARLALVSEEYVVFQRPGGGAR